ncbi:MAG: hypothetical protein WC734_01725 [Patescibacteria group bacterium]|jgi:hypothetical protein
MKKAIIISIIVVVTLGVLFPLVGQLIQSNNSNVPPICRSQAALLVPKSLRLITLFQDTKDYQPIVVSKARTIFSIPVRKISFPTMEDCRNGTSAIAE